MTQKAAIYILFVTTLLTSSCISRKVDNFTPVATVTPIDVQNISNCHFQENPLPSQIVRKLEGYWLWTKRNNPFIGETTNSTKQVLLHFNDANIFSVTENTIVVAQGTWTLTSIGSDSWKLQTSKSSEYLLGDIYLCGNQLVLSDAARDGYINLFEKRN